MIARRLYAALAVTALLSASVGASSAPPAGAADGAMDRVVLNPLAEVSVDALAGFRDRPLFVPSRRPPPPPAPATEEPEPVAVVPEDPGPVEVDPPAVKLAGILEIDTQSVALLRDDVAGTTMSVRLGDPVESWTVAAIGASSITLEYEGRQHEIRIFEPGGEGAGPPVDAAAFNKEPVGPDAEMPLPDDGTMPVDGQVEGQAADGGGFAEPPPDPGRDGADPDAGLYDEDAGAAYDGMDPNAIDGSGQ